MSNMIKIEKNMTDMKNSINQDTTWEDLATVINFATELQGKALEVAINKGLAEEMFQSEIIEKLRGAGCRLKHAQMELLVGFHSFKIELRNSPRAGDSLNEPETAFQHRYLGKGTESTSAIEKAEEFDEAYREKGSSPTAVEIQKAAQIKNKLKKKTGRDNRRGDLPQYLGSSQIIAFREWCKEHDVDLEKNKPKLSVTLLMETRDETIDDLYSHLGEWKAARKIMLDKLHPDKGGNTLAFQFAKMFDDLMKSLASLLAWIEYEDAVIAYKKEWWREYDGAQNEA